MTSKELNNQANGTRLSRLLIDKGTKVLKAAFDLQYPPATLAADLIANKPTLRRLRYNAINAAQWWLLYPSAGSPDSKNFDITLLTVLLQHLCGLMPATGWSAMPPPSNTSIAANILRIKLYRNQVYAHITTTQIDDVSFEHLWQEISRALVAFGIPQREIDELKEAPISPKEDEYIEQLKEWKKSEDEMKEKLEEMHGMVKDTHGMVKDTHGMVKDTHGTTEDTHGMMKDTHGMTKDTHGMMKDAHGMLKGTHGIVKDTHGTMKDTHGMTKDTHGMVKDIHGQFAGVYHGESDENVLLQLANCNFRGNIEFLAKSCYPGTRDWLLQKVNNWFEEEESESRVMIVTAGPGVGKSVFSAKVCELYEKNGRLAASHFCKFNNSDYRNPHTMLQSLASHMCQSVAGFQEQLIEGLRRPHSRQTIPEAFRVLLNDPLHTLTSQKPMVIVIDALDESEVGGKSELLDVIAEEFPKLPKWVKFLVTSRPELVVQKKLSHLNPLEISPGDKDNKNDLVHYLSGCLSGKCKDDGVIEMLAMKCEGSFLYAYYAQRQLLHQRSKSLTPKDVESFMCEGISTFYEKQFKSLEIYLNKLSPTRCNFKQFLAVLAAAEGPLPLSLLPTCLGLPESLDFHVRKGINDIMSAFLPVYDDCLTIYHKSLVDWLQSNGYQEHSYTVSKDIGTEFLWRMCKTQYQEMTPKFANIELSKAIEYALKHGTSHFHDLDENYATNSGSEMEREPTTRIKIDEQGGCVAFSAANAFLQFPPEAVSEPVTLTCTRVRYKNCAVKAKKGDAFCSRIFKIEPEGIDFKKPVTVLLAHSGAEDGAYADYYDLVVQKLKGECEDIKTERMSKSEDLPPELVSNFDDVIEDLPFAKATIVETCTLVVAGRIRSEEIVIQPTETCVYSKSYGNESKLKITFPAGAVKEKCSLSVQLFPADEILDTNTCRNEDLICFPTIKVSGQEKPFLTLVDVELIYSHDDVADLNETFFPIGQTFPFSDKYGVLLRNHKDSQAKHKWKKAKDDKNAEITRMQKNTLKITFSVEHFCKRSPIVKKREKVNLENIEENNSSGYLSSKLHIAIVLAVQDIDDEANTLTTVLASKTDLKDVERKWSGCKGIGFERRLRCDNDVYFCVWYEQEHLDLKDDILRFIPDNITEKPNAIDVGINLNKKFLRFSWQRCEKENHETREMNVDTVTKIQIQTRNSTTTSGNQSNPAVPTASGRPTSQTSNSSQHGVLVSPNYQSSIHPSADESQNEVVNAIKSNCKVFEEKLEAKVKDKLRIIGDLIEQPRGGKATKVVDVAAPVTTVVASLACGITLALGFATFGAGSFAGAAVAATALVVTKLDKRRKKADAKVIQSISTEVVSSVLECIVKEVGKELSRIFEFQLFMLKDEKQLEILAHHAVDLMFDLKDGETFDRNTLLKNVLKGRKDNKNKLTTRDDKENWCVQDVFRKVGLRKAVPTSVNLNRVKFEYFVKPYDACNVQRYGYRDQMLIGMKCPTSRVEPSANIEKNISRNACADCCSISTCTIKLRFDYFAASDVDEDYTIQCLEATNYQPLHCLVQSPKVLERFACSIKNTPLDKTKPSLVNYVSEMYNRSLNSTLKPVYRPQSPSRVPDLTKANLRECDFSHADFTGSKLDGCDFTECTIFFGTFEKANLTGSKFVETHISHCILASAQVQGCEWTNVKVLHSCVCGARNIRKSKNPCGGNIWAGTHLSKTINEDASASDDDDGQDGNSLMHGQQNHIKSPSNKTSDPDDGQDGNSRMHGQQNHDHIESSPDETSDPHGGQDGNYEMENHGDIESSLGETLV